MFVTVCLSVVSTQYLAQQGLDDTLTTLKRECSDHGRPLSSVLDSSTRNNVQSELMVAFECGERDAFFTLWEENVGIRGDPTCQDLEFSLSIYFALYPLRYYKMEEAPLAMEQFKTYLNTRSNVLSKSTEFAIYCALPYVPDPMTHPSFRHLFTESWSTNLRLRLQQFLIDHHISTSSDMSLTDMYAKYSALTHNDSLSISHDTSHDHDAMAQRLYEMQTSYQLLSGIAIELVEALEASVRGKMLNPDYIQDMCSRLFEASVLPDSSKDDRELRTSAMALRESVSTPSNVQYQPLDYSRLKQDLLLLPSNTKCLILQALRHRLSQSRYGTQRSSVLFSYIDNDVLGLCDGDIMRSVFVESADDKYKEQYCRLLNGLSSLRSGRDYLQSSSTLVHNLCAFLTSLHNDGVLLRNVLGTVQKLSLRRVLQLSMIDKGLIKWALTMLSNVDTLSEYTLRYTLALLMNLCLRHEGKQVCVEMLPKPLEVLSELLEHSNNEVRSYVNGILYGLFCEESLRQAALNMNMLERLQCSLRSSNTELQSQLHYIIDKIQSTANGDSTDDDTDEDEEDDPEVIEGDDDDIIVAVSGENILQTYYTTDNLQNIDSLKPLSRPVTPRIIHSIRPHTANGGQFNHKDQCTISGRPGTSRI